MIPVLTIAGSDASGGAGIEADIKTFCAHGLYGMSVITSVVAENTFRVINAYDMSAQAVGDQIEAIFEDIAPKAVKIGMLPNAKIMQIVAEKLEKFNAENVVLDPVMQAKNGFNLMSERENLLSKMLGIIDLITPNIPEAEILTNTEISNENDMKNAALIIAEKGAKSVLIKGGHKKGTSDFLLFDEKFFEYKTKFINTKNTHGTGCTLSSAIASNLALGRKMNEAVENAKKYIQGAIENSLDLGHGAGPLNHFYNIC